MKLVAFLVDVDGEGSESSFNRYICDYIIVDLYIYSVIYLLGDEMIQDDFCFISFLHVVDREV